MRLGPKNVAPHLLFPHKRWGSVFSTRPVGDRLTIVPPVRLVWPTLARIAAKVRIGPREDPSATSDCSKTKYILSVVAGVGCTPTAAMPCRVFSD